MGTMLVAPRPHRVVMQAVRRRLGAQPHAPRFTPARLIRRTGSPRLSVLDRGMVHQRARRRQVLAGTTPAHQAASHRPRSRRRATWSTTIRAPALGMVMVMAAELVAVVVPRHPHRVDMRSHRRAPSRPWARTSCWATLVARSLWATPAPLACCHATAMTAHSRPPPAPPLRAPATLPLVAATATSPRPTQPTQPTQPTTRAVRAAVVVPRQPRHEGHWKGPASACR